MSLKVDVFDVKSTVGKFSPRMLTEPGAHVQQGGLLSCSLHDFARLLDIILNSYGERSYIIYYLSNLDLQMN